ncbi:iron ABC transporter permease [Nocardia sp. CDC159]|uniref:Iron ABC transporter permease n=1 Tax=Nocardia pulmonis TaxID=2951408 RepID=A0A9X2E1V2_9NOCA|nr:MULTISPECIES: iron ABC transporter permease [Nocardia]MCM6772502.1 iron ABC transporter permease [Nocardia pulmonis]MCM6784840.1 iron ABC transporter permease [Nocardia sp. CDC159]
MPSPTRSEARDTPVETAATPRRFDGRLVSRIGVPVLLALALGAAMVMAIGFGTVAVAPPTVLRVVLAHTVGGAGTDPLSDQIVWQFRAPRVVLAALVGAALGLAGACLQTLVRNPLADPYLFGVTSGASLGAVLAMTGIVWVTGTLGVTGCAFVGAMLSLLVVFVLAQRGGQVRGADLVLAAIAVSYLGTAVTSYLQLRAKPAELRGVMFWLLGSLSSADWNDLIAPAVAVAAALLVLPARAQAMNALTLGDDTTAGLGVHPNRLRLLLLLVSALLTATAVAVAGGIGFVGLIVPNAARLLAGPDHRRTLPIVTLGGALFLVLVDLAARTVDRPNEIPIGIITAVLGAPAFLVLLRRRREVAS